VDLVELSKTLREQLSRLLLNTDTTEASDGELAAMISFAIAFPQGFMALVDTYDVLRYLLAPHPSCVCMLPVPPGPPSAWIRIRHSAAETGSPVFLALIGYLIFISFFKADFLFHFNSECSKLKKKVIWEYRPGLLIGLSTFYFFICPFECLF
jgi:hypothetical protein